MTPFFTRMSLILSIASGVLILLAVIAGEQVKEGWQINFTSRNVNGLWYFVQLDTDRGVMYSVQLASEIGNPPSLSPNGRYVAFHYVGLLMLFNGRENIELTTRSSVMPTWSPDGRFIAYIGSGSVGLYVIEVETGDITGPIDLQLEASLMEWSPESDQLVFSARNDRQLYVVGRDGRNIRRLTDNDNLNLLMP